MPGCGVVLVFPAFSTILFLLFLFPGGAGSFFPFFQYFPFLLHTRFSYRFSDPPNSSDLTVRALRNFSVTAFPRLLVSFSLLAHDFQIPLALNHLANHHHGPTDTGALYILSLCAVPHPERAHISAPNTSTDTLLLVLAPKHSSLFSICNFCPINLFLILVLLKHVEPPTRVLMTPANQATLILQLTDKNIFLLLHFPL